MGLWKNFARKFSKKTSPKDNAKHAPKTQKGGPCVDFDEQALVTGFRTPQAAAP